MRWSRTSVFGACVLVLWCALSIGSRVALDRPTPERSYPMMVESLADFAIVDDSAFVSAVEATKFQFKIEKDVPLDQIRDLSFARRARAELLKEGKVR